MFYAYDKMTGAVVHELQLPANTCGNPMTYMVNGKQYIVGGGRRAELPRRAGGAGASLAGSWWVVAGSS